MSSDAENSNAKACILFVAIVVLIVIIVSATSGSEEVVIYDGVPRGPLWCTFSYGSKDRLFFQYINVPAYVNAIENCDPSPTSFKFSGYLTTGLSFNPTTGTISGRPTDWDFQYTCTITPSNADGYGTPLQLRITVRKISTITCGGGSTNSYGVNADKEGLLSIFVSTNGHQWESNSNWGREGDCCSTSYRWYNGNNNVCAMGRVRALDLQSNQVRMLGYHAMHVVCSPASRFRSSAPLHTGAFKRCNHVRSAAVTHADVTCSANMHLVVVMDFKHA